jgi:hypothetical protein
MAVDETTRGFDGGVVIDTIQPDDSNGPAVQSNDIGLIDRHPGLLAAYASFARKMSGRAFRFEGDRQVLF